MVLPERQGRGLASAGVTEALRRADAARRWQALHASPATTNAPSNALCRRHGFDLLGPIAYTYRGQTLRVNQAPRSLDGVKLDVCWGTSRPRAQAGIGPVRRHICGGHLLGGRLFMSLVSHPLEALAFALGELDAVGGVGDVEVKHGPDERQAAGLTGEPTDDLGAAFDLAERPFKQVRRSPPPAMPGGIAQVHHERVEVVGETLRGVGGRPLAAGRPMVDARRNPRPPAVSRGCSGTG
jgi:hypothetical protein